MVAASDIRIGQKWRDDLGSKFIVVGFDGEQFVLVKRHDTPKKNLHVRGSYPSLRRDFDSWTLLEDAR